MEDLVAFIIAVAVGIWLLTVIFQWIGNHVLEISLVGGTLLVGFVFFRWGGSIAEAFSAPKPEPAPRQEPAFDYPPSNASETDFGTTTSGYDRFRWKTREEDAAEAARAQRERAEEEERQRRAEDLQRQAEERQRAFEEKQRREREKQKREWEARRESAAKSPKAAAWYEILNVSPDASTDIIKTAYRKAIQQYHPDRVAGLGSKLRELAEQETKRLNLAYEEGLAKRGAK